MSEKLKWTTPCKSYSWNGFSECLQTFQPNPVKNKTLVRLWMNTKRKAKIMKSRCEVQTSKREVLDWYLSKDCSVLLIPLHHSASLLTAAFPRPLHPKAYTVYSSRSQWGSLLYINLFCNFFFSEGCDRASIKLLSHGDISGDSSTSGFYGV